jgi:hypothetical protein
MLKLGAAEAMIKVCQAHRQGKNEVVITHIFECLVELATQCPALGGMFLDSGSVPFAIAYLKGKERVRCSFLSESVALEDAMFRCMPVAGS